MKLILFVEGHTEYRSLPRLFKSWLDPRLRSPLGIKPVKFEGVADYLKHFARKAQLYLDDRDRQDIVGVLGLIDLYGAPLRFPNGIDSARKSEWAKDHLQRQVDRDLFRQYLAVHETEAWLLSDPSLLPEQVSKKLPPAARSPETVDFDEPPAKLLDKLYSHHLKRKYKKSVDGPTLFGKLDPDRVRGCCPLFKQMLDEILALAQAYGQ